MLRSKIDWQITREERHHCATQWILLMAHTLLQLKLWHRKDLQNLMHIITLHVFTHALQTWKHMNLVQQFCSSCKQCHWGTKN